ncbi:MAG TPA: ABC transporter permease [Epulopiscium sp.]|nr:ABC transporter permease [Candidatus Epulonipiscium sp.]
MRGLFTVLKFELVSFLRNKVFIISTLVICLIAAVGLSFPTIKDAFATLSNQDSKAEADKDIKHYGVIDKNGILQNTKDLTLSFMGGTLTILNDISELENKINSDELEAGYIIQSPTSYEYVVKNNDLIGGNTYGLKEILVREFRIQEFKGKGIEYSQIEDLMNPTIEVETKILGKDSAGNYFYTYALVLILYMMILLYGQLIATSVASEKSNRTMEVLVTSTKSTNLIFGKVLGLAIASVLQTGLIITTSLMAYKLNAAAWDNKLDFVFNIPADVLLSFAAFGILGYLLYAFIYGALGALVSRTEDVSAIATPVMLLFIGVFMISIIGMTNTTSLVFRIASFVPFSSFMAMFIRVCMGSVSHLEVIISLFLLAGTTGLTGLLASKIYRAGTLMYGNRIKLKDLLTIFKSE